MEIGRAVVVPATKTKIAEKLSRVLKRGGLVPPRFLLEDLDDRKPLGRCRRHTHDIIAIIHIEDLAGDGA